MPRPNRDPDSLEYHLHEMVELSEEDMDLLVHVFEEDNPPQGLHQRGFKRRELEEEHDIWR